MKISNKEGNYVFEDISENSKVTINGKDWKDIVKEKKHLRNMEKAKPTLKNIIAYIQGNLRYKLFYSNFAFLIRPHIREQIEVRINSMDQECYNAGECKICGCQTTSLQMANKACDKPCYPEMLSKKNWKFLKEGLFYPDGKRWWKLKYNKFIIDNE